MKNYDKLRWKFVSSVYAAHNSSPQIKAALGKCINQLKDGESGLNIGAGHTRIHPAILNLDIEPGPNIDYCAPAEELPFPDNKFSLIITQEVLEHVHDPETAVREMYRVLKPGGILYCQLPFIIGYHPCPDDYLRFTKEGLRHLVENAKFKCSEIAVAVGPATGFYRIAVEFFAIFFSVLIPSLYLPAKALIALLLYPIKYLDYILIKSTQVDRIAGGYYIIARKE